jgi:hypothetical protein
VLCHTASRADVEAPCYLPEQADSLEAGETSTTMHLVASRDDILVEWKGTGRSEPYLLVEMTEADFLEGGRSLIASRSTSKSAMSADCGGELVEPAFFFSDYRRPMPCDW